MSEHPKPEILNARWVAHSRLFHVEEQRLRFSNGVERTYERLNPGFHGAVMVVGVFMAAFLVGRVWRRDW